MNNVLVTGSSGMLGKELKLVSKDYINLNVHFKKKSNLDISKKSDLLRVVEKNNIDTIVNCAAFTDVLGAEKNKKKCDKINIESLKNIVEVCFDFDVKLIHFSTDYVFDGYKKKPYLEYDSTNPLNHYGKSKLAGEKFLIKSGLQRSIIIRTSYLYSNLTKNNILSNFVNNIKALQNIYITSNPIVSPTNANDLANDIFKIIPKLKNNKIEIYNYSNGGSCSIYDFAFEINSLFGNKVKIVVKDEKNCCVKRPEFSALDNKKISEIFNLNIPDWRTSLNNSIIYNG